MRTYDFHRGLMTALCAGIAGGLLWLAGAYVGTRGVGHFWASMGIVAGAGLVMALSQLLGGWTKFGLPRFSLGVFLLGFLPVLIVVGWTLLVNQPIGGWQHGNLASWSRSVGISDVIHDLQTFDAVLAFGFGLVFGFCFDTMGPRRRDELVVDRRHETVVEPAPAAATRERTAAIDRDSVDEPVSAERAEVERTHEAPVAPTEHERVPSQMD